MYGTGKHEIFQSSSHVAHCSLEYSKGIRCCLRFKFRRRITNRQKGLWERKGLNDQVTSRMHAHGVRPHRNSLYPWFPNSHSTWSYIVHALLRVLRPTRASLYSVLSGHMLICVKYDDGTFVICITSSNVPK